MDAANSPSRCCRRRRFTIALFLLWEIVCSGSRCRSPSCPLPPTSSARCGSSAAIADNSFVTLWTTLAGFLIATAFACCSASGGLASADLRGHIYPVLIGFNSIPKVAVVPVLILCSGWARSRGAHGRS